MEQMESRYDHKASEEKGYDLWEKSGYFNPDKLPKRHKKPFTIIMPPPNANGSLHVGHALFVTIQDIIIRFQRMTGKKALWLPGADHAGFETQVVYDKKLEKEGRDRHTMSREQLWQEIWDFTQKSKSVMENQLRRLGASCDWSREKFTLDPDIIRETQETFIQLYKDGLIYRGTRIVNWCVKHQTTLSDLEVKYIERKDPLYYMTYGPFTLATVRPETKFGDTAVAVHPDDKRYKKYIGKEIEVQTLLGPVKMQVVADQAVDPKFGTGVVKITPAHDPVDYEVGKRHNLEVREVINRFGRLNEKTGPYQGLKASEARQKVAEDLKAHGLLVKVDEEYTHNIAVCYKCNNPVEPLVIPQWFVRMTDAPPTLTRKEAQNHHRTPQVSLRDAAVKAVKSKKIAFATKRFEKLFLHWMKDLRDWNISRQIVWGIRIPAWFCSCEGELQQIHIGMKPPTRLCITCREAWHQDPDVLDTWFSSGQWPFLALGYPKSRDYKTFYPTSVMETGWDILFFWVARMIMLGLYRTHKVPFAHVYLHGLVRDKDRQKMSKSKGNVIDPLGISDIYGTDALRMALIIGTTAGNDPILSEDKVRGYRNFATKIWNASRFILMNYHPTTSKPTFTKHDKQHLAQLQRVKKKVTHYLDTFDFHHAGEALYHYFWHTFADTIIESAKPRFHSDNIKDKAAAQYVLITILKECLKMLHPFMPYVTEDIWGKMPGRKNLLIIERW